MQPAFESLAPARTAEAALKAAAACAVGALTPQPPSKLGGCWGCRVAGSRSGALPIAPTSVIGRAEASPPRGVPSGPMKAQRPLPRPWRPPRLPSRLGAAATSRVGTFSSSAAASAAGRFAVADSPSPRELTYEKPARPVSTGPAAPCPTRRNLPARDPGGRAGLVSCRYRRATWASVRRVAC
eukprot:scaffold58854_cov26-Tisochrysis_lutea.AAC.3